MRTRLDAAGWLILCYLAMCAVVYVVAWMML